MLIYTIRRFNLFIITLLIVTLVGYSLLRSDPTLPWATQTFLAGWFTYLSDLTQLNFGISKAGVPVLDELRNVFPATLELCLVSFIVSLLIAIPLGTLAGLRPGKWLDTLISFISMSGYSAPIFWVALLLIMIFSLHFQMLPISGRYDLLYDLEPITGFALVDTLLSKQPDRFAILQSVLEHMALPCLVLALAPTTQVISLMRNSVADVIAQNYIRVARLRGFTNYEIVRQHVLRNAIPPIIPKIGIQLSSTLTLAIITESIFNWPGIGRWLLDALSQQDYVAIQGGVIVVATLVLSANIVSDLLGAVINPLVRKKWYVNQ